MIYMRLKPSWSDGAHEMGTGRLDWGLMSSTMDPKTNRDIKLHTVWEASLHCPGVSVKIIYIKL